MPGDRVAILLPQSFETAIAHAGIYKLGAIALPLALLFGIEALEYRLRDAGAAAVVTNRFGLEKIAAIRARLPDLKCVVLVDAEAPETIAFADAGGGPFAGFRSLPTRRRTIRR